jgi:hypothetical protein
MRYPWRSGLIADGRQLMKIDVHKTALDCNTLITSLNNVHLGHERALITLNPYETQQLIEALQKTQRVTNKKRRRHLLDFVIFLMKRGLYFRDLEGKLHPSKPLIKEHLEDLALNTIAGKGMAVGGVQAEVAQEEIESDLAEMVYKAEKEV